jgi:DNA-binding transcriptional MerR regulator
VVAERIAEQDDLLSIGEFARLSGLSIGALRHYDTVGLLVPASVDPSTSYRRYRRGQVDDARTVGLLRDLEMPLEEIREVLGTDDVRARRDLLARHRTRVTARATRLHRVIHQLGHLIDPSQTHQEPDMTTTTPTTELDPQTQRSLAAGLFNRVWELLEKSDRTADDDQEMVNSAHASRLHWTGIGGAKEKAIGDWQVSRVYSVLGRGEPAVHHARLALGYATQVDGETWLLASAYEGLARAYAVSGDMHAAAEWKAKAVTRLDEVTDPDDRQIVQADIDTLPL